ncbi:MAG: AI-2E family transporter [Candidatus Nealsonbacteria bacterium]|nr:AI-2E family transporter [Candidatus Nealsonbacteria bacterium]
MTNEERTLDISWGTILKIAVAFLVFYLIFLVRDILILVIFALIISILFNPAIAFLQKRKVPRVMAASLVYILVFGFLGFFIYLIVPIFIFEIQQFSQFFPQYFEKLAPPLKDLGIAAFDNFEVFLASLGQWLLRASANVFSAISAVFGGIFSTLTIFTIAFFLSLEEKGLDRMVALLSPKRYEAYILDILHRSETKVSAWFGSRILACLFVGVATFLACKILSIKYAISFAFLAGVLNIIPFIGPLITALLVFLFTALDSLSRGIIIVIIFSLIQQLEGNILTPILSKRLVGLPPILVLIALMVGGKLWGILGGILAIPLAGVIFEFLRDFLKKKKEERTVVI